MTTMDMGNMGGMDMGGMDMSGMDMGGMNMMTSTTSLTSQTMMSMDHASHTMGMDHASHTMGMDHASHTMSMPTATASSSMGNMNMGGMDMGGMDMGGMDMSGDHSMTMNMWLTTRYKNTPVVFKTLTASTGAKAFGIFCALFFSAFAFRGLMFLSSYLEQVVFHNYTNAILVEEECGCDDDTTDPESKPTVPKAALPRQLSFMEIVKGMFILSPTEIFQDIIRLLLAFTIVMFGYALMLAAMSFVLIYFFAICLGLAFGEMFFNRLAIVLNVNKALGACAGLH
ncbi:hypothetical protein CANINC_000673 [Pichia inconspicua]|uniref:Copper transport protein n=1 Tax=Pichia inconspicua TaxID=52247 RepID=A0A4T0X6R4_9ASCO|nr:hypothetical protein CANINC_000673 [[Candida] inconspicua]